MKEKIMMAAVLVSVSAASALMLAGINAFSYDVIAKNMARKKKTAVLSVLEIPYKKNAIEETYDKKIEERDFPEGKVFLSVSKGPSGKQIEGAAFILKGPGFWGGITAMVGVDPSDFSIKGIEILEQIETPGLGARIEEKEFRAQFKGKRIDKPIIARTKGATLGPNDVSAVTGATVTSKSLETIINEKSRAYIDLIRRHDLG